MNVPLVMLIYPFPNHKFQVNGLNFLKPLKLNQYPRNS